MKVEVSLYIMSAKLLENGCIVQNKFLINVWKQQWITGEILDSNRHFYLKNTFLTLPPNTKEKQIVGDSCEYAIFSKIWCDFPNKVTWRYE
jgi:hypothetical protein